MSAPAMWRRLFSVSRREAAELLGFSQNKIASLLDFGQLESVDLARQPRGVSVRSIEVFTQERVRSDVPSPETIQLAALSVKIDQTAKDIAAVRSRRNGFVYVLQGIDGGRVKVGWSLAPEERRKTLQPGSPVELRVVSTVPAPERQFDLVIHNLLPRSARRHGEWFEPTEDVSRILYRLGFRNDSSHTFPTGHSDGNDTRIESEVNQ